MEYSGKITAEEMRGLMGTVKRSVRYSPLIKSKK